MPVIKSVIKKEGKNGAFWVCVVDGEEVLAFDGKVVEFEGKDCPYPIAGGEGGKKKYIQFPKAGGFQKGGAGGGWKGKSDKELFLQALTMAMAYSKDLIVAGLPFSTPLPEMKTITDLTLNTYKAISGAILADLAKLVPAVPVQTEAPKEAIKAPEKPPQETSPPKAGTDKEAKTVKEKLEKKMWSYLRNMHSDSDDNFKILLGELTTFIGKDGKEVSVTDFSKLSDKWAGSCMGKLETLIEEEERKNMANAPGMEDIKY